MFTIKTSTAKSLLLGTVLVSAMIAPLPAVAQNTYIMFVNARSDDGVYRPALQIVRGGQVFLFRTTADDAENPFTLATLRNKALLTTWLMENANLSLTEAEANAIIIEVPPNPQKVVTDSGADEEQGGEVDPVDPGDNEEPGDGVDPEDPPCECGYQCGDETICFDRVGMLHTLQQDNLTVADLDEAQRIAAYATL